MDTDLRNIVVDKTFGLDSLEQSPVCRLNIIDDLGFVSPKILFGCMCGVFCRIDCAGYFPAGEKRLLDGSLQ